MSSIKRKCLLGEGSSLLLLCLTMPWSASGLREELCMNHSNGPHSERNDPSLSTVGCCLLKCTMCLELHQASSLPLSCLVASAHREGLWRDGLCLVMDAWFLKVLPCTAQALGSQTRRLCSADHPGEHAGDTPSWGPLSPQSWFFLVRGVVVDGPCLSKTGKCPERWEVSTAF